MSFYKKDYHTTISDGLAPVQVAQAHHRSYALLSELFLRGITKTTLPTVQAVFDLGEHLPDPIDIDALAADHYQLFGFNVFPFESIFLDGSGLLGGAVTEEVRHALQSFSFATDVSSHPPDHIGQELAAMAYLSMAEAEAIEKNQLDTAVSIQHHQLTFLQTHLLRWLVPFVLAIKAQGNEFYTAVAELALALVNHHYEILVGEVDPNLPSQPLPHAPNILDNDKTGLKEIAKYFITPIYSGLYLSRDNIANLARHLDLPRGFGDRQQLLTNLMRTAVQYDQFPQVLELLNTAVLRWQTNYATLTDEMPLLTPFIQPWQNKSETTFDHIAKIRDRIETIK